MSAGASGGAVDELVRVHRAELVAFVRGRAGHVVDPDDVVQQAVVRALSAAGQLRAPERGRAWLFRIVRNVLVDELRALGLPVRAPLEEADEPAVDADAEAGAHADPCRCALALAKTLKPEYASILERVVLDDVPVAALAAELGLTANNATVRLHRARRALRAVLQEHCGVTSLRACLACVCDHTSCAATD
jgi:RNA polymerase sigma-70 factor (ECF subfamily)